MKHAAHLIETLAESPQLSEVRRGLQVYSVIQDAVAIQQIAAPTFEEAARADFVSGQFVKYGLQDVAIDEVYNVYGRWPGTEPSRPALLVSAHTDTVFDLATDLTIQRKDGRIYGPGLGDNSLGVAGLLALLDIFNRYDLRAPSDIWFVANSREEGLGDLGGIRAVWERLRDHLGAALVIEGMALGRIYHAGIAVRRLRITCHAPGGHSWLHYGRPSAIHGLIRLGDRILDLQPPEKPRTTYNIGLIEGGHSVNSLATSASFYLDMRSEELPSLETLEAQVRDAIQSLHVSPLSFAIEVVGDRPAGSISVDHPLVGLATAALNAVHLDAVHEIGSTDANVLLANGLPTVTVGVSYGGNAHRLDEYIETGPLKGGIWHLVLLTMAAADQIGTW